MRDRRRSHIGPQEFAGHGRLAASRPVGRQFGEQTEARFGYERAHSCYIYYLAYIFLSMYFGYSDGHIRGFSMFGVREGASFR